MINSRNNRLRVVSGMDVSLEVLLRGQETVVVYLSLVDDHAFSIGHEQ